MITIVPFGADIGAQPSPAPGRPPVAEPAAGKSFSAFLARLSVAQSPISAEPADAGGESLEADGSVANPEATTETSRNVDDDPVTPVVLPSLAADEDAVDQLPRAHSMPPDNAMPATGAPRLAEDGPKPSTTFETPESEIERQPRPASGQIVAASVPGRQRAPEIVPAAQLPSALVTTSRLASPLQYGSLAASETTLVPLPDALTALQNSTLATAEANPAIPLRQAMSSPDALAGLEQAKGHRSLPGAAVSGVPLESAQPNKPSNSVIAGVSTSDRQTPDTAGKGGATSAMPGMDPENAAAGRIGQSVPAERISDPTQGSTLVEGLPTQSDSGPVRARNLGAALGLNEGTDTVRGDRPGITPASATSAPTDMSGLARRAQPPARIPDQPEHSVVRATRASDQLLTSSEPNPNLDVAIRDTRFEGRLTRPYLVMAHPARSEHGQTISAAAQSPANPGRARMAMIDGLAPDKPEGPQPERGWRGDDSTGRLMLETVRHPVDPARSQPRFLTTGPMALRLVEPGVTARRSGEDRVQGPANGGGLVAAAKPAASEFTDAGPTRATPSVMSVALDLSEEAMRLTGSDPRLVSRPDHVAGTFTTAHDIPGMRADLPRFVPANVAEMLVRQTDRQVDFAINPEELGRVRMSLSTTENGVLLMINADRADTLDLMRRHIDQLAQEFRRMGYQDVAFDFGQSRSGGERDTRSGGTGIAGAGFDAVGEMPAEPPTPMTTSGLDLRL